MISEKDRNQHHRHHQPGALGGNGETGNQIIGERHQQCRESRDLLDRPALRKGGKQAESQSQANKEYAGGQCHVEPGYGNDMGKAGEPQRLHRLRRYSLSLIGDDGGGEGSGITADGGADAFGNCAAKAVKPHIGPFQPTLVRPCVTNG
jgi:hypothetical protein